MTSRTRSFLVEIDKERDRQDEKWGEQNHGADVWYRILGEEVGEVARALNEKDPINLQEELIQVAAVCVAWLESIERRRIAWANGSNGA